MDKTENDQKLMKDITSIMHDQKSKVKHVITVNSQTLNIIDHMRDTIPSKADYRRMEKEVNFLKDKIH